MKKFGLYVVDRSDNCLDVVNGNEAASAFYPLTEDNRRNATWERKGLANDGHTLELKTVKVPKKKFGLYTVGDSLFLDGTFIAKSSHPSPALDADTASFGDAVLDAGNTCINITLANYNLLRAGHAVPGYAKYSPFVVYNIVSNPATAPTVQYAGLDGMEDRIYNSFTDELPHNTLTDQNYKSLDTPQLQMRYFNPVLRKGEGLRLEYFVDTKYCDSVHKGQIGDTFTVEVFDEWGRLMYRHTTYAGQFIVNIPAFKDQEDNDFVGETWFRIHCINSIGCGSLDRFFAVLVKDGAENIYEVTSADLASKGITLNSGYDNHVAGYRNIIGLQQLIDEKAAAGYTGIKLYNPTPNEDWDSADNAVYYVDKHPNYGTNESPDLFSQDYYLLRYVDGFLEGIGSRWGSMDKNDLEPYRIVPGKTITFENGKTFTIPNDVTPLGWVRHDGARSYRDENDKIMVDFDFALNENEVHATGDVKLKTSALNRITPKTKAKGLIAKPDGETFNYLGVDYIYAVWCNGGPASLDVTSSDRGVELRGTVGLRFPDHFTLDLNCSCIKITDSTDLAAGHHIINLSGSTDVVVKNGKIEGCYTPENFKLFLLNASLTISQDMAEAVGPCVSLYGAQFCTLDRVKVCHGFAFELYNNDVGMDVNTFPEETNSPVLASFGMSGAKSVSFTETGIVGNDGTIDRSTALVRGGNGARLLETDSIYYDATTGTDICLVTSNLVNLGKTEITCTNRDSDETTTWNNAGLFCGSTSGNQMKRLKLGSRHEMFVHYYDSNGGYLESIKTEPWRKFMVIDGAAKARFSLYGVGAEIGGVPQALLNSSGKAVATTDFYAAAERYSEGNLMHGCLVDYIRLSMASVGINLAYIDCVFKNMGQIPYAINTSRYVTNIEENCGIQEILSFIGCKTPNEKDITDEVQRMSATNHESCREIYVKNCHGLSFQFNMKECYFVDSSFYALSPTTLKSRYNNYQSVFKRCTSLRYTLSTTGGAANGTTGALNTCAEPVADYITVEDSLLSFQIADNQQHILHHRLRGRERCLRGMHHPDAITYSYTQDITESTLDEDL